MRLGEKAAERKGSFFCKANVTAEAVTYKAKEPAGCRRYKGTATSSFGIGNWKFRMNEKKKRKGKRQKQKAAADP